MMNVQAAPPTYTPAGGSSPPMGGLPMPANPMAQQLQSMGRGEDTMLIHMTPEEVNSLQGLAMAAGGSLTINPQTGLPEASFLKRLLPMLLGVGLNFVLPGSGVLAKGALAKTVGALGGKAATSGLLVGAGTTAITGDLNKGLMAGLGAFGGASLAGGVQGAIGGASKAAGAAAPPTAVPEGVLKAFAEGQAPVGEIAAAGTKAAAPAAPSATMRIPGLGVQTAAPGVTGAVKTGLPGFFQGFGNTAKGTMTGLAGKAAVPMAATGLLGTVSDATTPGFKTAGGQIDNSYQGPYTAQRRNPVFAGTTEDILAGDGGQQQFFDVDIPEIYNMQGQVVQPGSHTAPGTMIYQNVLNPRARKNEPMYSSVGTPFMRGMREEEDPMSLLPTRRMGMNTMMGGGFAEGGEVNMRDGAFVVDARTVSELGNGSSNAGIEALSRMGGRPVRGPGDGVSDSVRASIGGKQEARVARDEVIFQPEAVRRLGGGSDKRGTQKLYAMMDKAHKARKKAKRGQDTRVRKGLA